MPLAAPEVSFEFVYAIRCTRPLLRRVGHLTPPGPGPEPAPTTALGNWYAKPLNIGRHRLVLCTSERTRLSVVVPAKDLLHLPDRLTESLVLLLRHLGVAPARIAREVTEMEWVRFAPTASRSVLASMTQFGLDVRARFALTDGPLVYLTDVDRELAETPCKPFGGGSPAAAVRVLMSSAT